MITELRTSEHRMRTWDGIELFYRAWIPPMATNALLLFHRGHEHSGRWEEFVQDVALGDVAIFAWDARGHGRSPGARGSAENLAVVIRDVDAFVRHVSDTHQIPINRMVVLAHSVGAVTVAAWVHDYAPPLRGMVLGTPAFRVRLYVPFAVPLLRARQKLLGHGYVKSYVKARMLTHDEEQAARYHADEFIFRQIAVNILLDLHDTSTRLLDDAGAIQVPTLLLAAGSDWVVELSAQQQFFDRLSSSLKEMEIYSGFFHAIFHEKERDLPVARAREFIVKRFQEASPPSSPLLDADKHGYTRAEYDRLVRGGGLRAAAIRLGMNTIGRLSDGIRLGWKAGFDSGATLDYVYENQPRGITPIGRLIDRAYLNSIGWRGIRVRKIHLEEALREVIEAVRLQGRPVRLVDIASGPGRYVLETIRDLAHIPITALLRDYKAANVEAGRRLADQMGLANVTFMQGDAFDRRDLASLTPPPTIGIVSGLYELFPTNEPVLNSLRGLADALGPGGYLIYTNQPWHPQIEFIAHVLPNREGKPWVMRRRTQAEMDELVRAAGFEKRHQRIDQWGIFSVSIAQRS